MYTWLLVLFVLHVSVSVIHSQSGVRNRCDSNIATSMNTDCANCRANMKVQCPLGYRKTTRGKGRRGCRYRVGGSNRRNSHPVRGCYHVCLRMRLEPACCDDYWGQDCQVCPIGMVKQSVCSGRGICDDGLTGNGTCSCRGNIMGSTCEVCSQSQQYGPNCEHNCTCVHGKCDSGVDRSGICQCDGGFGGANCEIVLAECATMNCHANARCLNDSGGLLCRCNSGYRGDGTNCSAINPCEDSTSNLCHFNATCLHTGPAEYNCMCKAGYTGDGRWCAPIDPCQYDNGGCSVNTLCQYTGPGQFVCNCKAGYNSTDVGCSLIDICGLYENTTCYSPANCTTVEENQVIGIKCLCPIGTVEIRRRCVMDLLTEISIANETGPFQNKLNFAIQMFSSNYLYELSYLTSFTLLVPRDDAFGSELGTPNSTITWRSRSRSHIILGMTIIDFTQETANSMYSMLGYNTSIKALRPIGRDDDSDNDDDGYYAVMMFDQQRNGKILDAAHWASNGVFYVVDTFLYPPAFPLPNYDASSLTFDQALSSLPMASVFLSLWQKDYLKHEWFQMTTFTLLLPSDDAFLRLQRDDMKFLSSGMGLHKLDIILRHHILPDSLTTTQIAFTSQVQTAFDTLPVNVSQSGTIYISEKQAKVIVAEIAVLGGSYIYVIDKVLVPSAIAPIVDNVCMDAVETVVPGLCGDCGRTSNICPDGGTRTNNPSDVPKRCIYEAMAGTNSLGQRLGCKFNCIKNTTIPVCCPGFFGNDCWSCPGPPNAACNSNGICQDGKDGSGLCACNAAFQGMDCSLCSRGNLYGSECNLNCTCIHGTCDNTISSRGICVAGSCESEWAGENCDTRVFPCGPEGIVCHQNAICIMSERDESCVCDAGYTGNGLNCVEFNPCIDSDERGGCDVNAVCMYLGDGNNTCECLESYEGDGRSCRPINLCHTDNGGCNQHADCIYTGPMQASCSCQFGYRGNGLICNEVNACLENNGGCHRRAGCARTGPGTRNCKCLDGYEGDGVHCVGSLLLEISEHSQLSTIKQWVDTVPSVQALFISIQYEQITAFLPRNSAWEAMSLHNYNDYAFWSTPDHLPYILRHHMVRGIITSSDLKLSTQLESLLPTSSIIITNVTEGSNIVNVETNETVSSTIPTLGANHAKIVMPDLQTYNGLLHIIESPLLPPRDVVQDHPFLRDIANNSTGTQFEHFSYFLSNLNNTGIVASIDSSGQPYTIFAVSNANLNPSAIGGTPQTTFSYHVILGKLIRVESIQSGQHETTMAGSGYQVTLVRRHAQFYVNGQVLTTTNIRTQHGILHGITSLLTPVKRNCNRVSMRLLRSNCMSCSSLLACPDGSDQLGKMSCKLNILPTSGVFSAAGCKLLCFQRAYIPRCCAGFFGDECEPCPGGVNNVCNKNGICYDGIKGNGTCNCSHPYGGPACDECATNLYGSNCQNQCNCVHGHCIDGKNGNGMCICDSDYWGAACDKVRNVDDACDGSCNSSTVCVEDDQGLGKCVCDTGYESVGGKCSPINPCKDANTVRCHQFASCMYAGAGWHKCMCKRGYQGDGTYCSEINPCLNSSLSLCDDNAHCFHTGPSQHNCICDTGFTGDGKTCNEINSCGPNNGGCHIYANCVSTGPGTHTCECFPNYVGDGTTNCTGTIFNELLSDSRFSWISSGRITRTALSASGPITAFLPMLIPDNLRQTADQFIFNHIVGCDVLTVEKLQNLPKIQTLAGNIINISYVGNSIFLNGNISIDEGRIFANGIVYAISEILQSNIEVKTNVSSNISPSTKNQMILQSLGANRFSQLMIFTGSLNMLSQAIHDTWTILLPTDSAIKKLSVYKQRQLLNDVGFAREYVRYHMIRTSNLLPTDAIKNLELTTMQGSGVLIGCSSNLKGQLEINEGEAFVTAFLSQNLFAEISIGPTSFYLIDTILEPPSVGGRCDIITNSTIEGTCSFCIGSTMSCPTGMRKIGQKSATCSASISTPFGRLNPAKPLAGCKPICSFYNVTSRCCDDHYGKDCHPCPGGPGKACSNNGNCSDGIDGSGSCTCKDGYRGFACELCDVGRFGKDCSPCNCSIHGTCFEGTDGSGMCRCDEGWTGSYCQDKIASPATCEHHCAANAVCLDSGKCQCMNGYVGNGSYVCDPQDLCATNPCSIHATCINNIFNVSCHCNFPYIGDGFACQGYDPCNDLQHSVDCHFMARCMYVGPNVTTCQCLPGYHGDGKRSCKPNTDWTRAIPKSCSVDNGGCSSNAICQDIIQISNQNPQVNCTCTQDYIGDGHVCNGNIFQVLKSGLYKTAKFFQAGVQRDIMFKIKLRQSRHLTLFVPSDDALVFKRINRRVLTRHVVSGREYSASDLRGTTSILVDSRSILPVQTSADGTIFINGVKMLTYDIPATNGIIHIINGVISNKKTLISPSTATGAVMSKSIPSTTTTSVAKINTGLPIDGGGFMSSVPNYTTTTSVTDKGIRKSSSSGVKVGIAIGILGLVLICVLLIYWKRRNSMFVFRPLSERQRIISPKNEESEELSGLGMENPAYDSTAFGEAYDDSPRGGLLTQFPTSGPLDGEEEHGALIGFTAP